MTDKCLILLVHGVGSHEPGAMIDAVTGAIKAVRPTFPDSDEYTVAHVTDDSAPRGSFPIYSRRLPISQLGELMFGEVYWADLSPIRANTFDLVRGVWRLIFGLRYIADSACCQPNLAAAILRKLLLCAIFVIRMPVLGLLTLGAALFLPLAIQAGGRLLSFPDQSLAWLADAGCSYAVAAALIASGPVVIVINALKRRPWGISLSVRDFYVCFCVLTLVVIVGAHFPTLQGILRGHFPVAFAPNDVRPYFFAAVLALTDWAREVAAAFMGLALIAWIAAIVRAPPPRKPGLAIGYCSAALQLLIWQLALAPLYAVTELGRAAAQNSFDLPVMQGGVSYVGARIAVIYLLALVIGSIWVVRWLWTQFHGAPTWPRRFPPRLILGMLAQLSLFLASCALITISMVAVVNELAKPVLIPAWVLQIATWRDQINGSLKWALLVIWPITIGAFACLVLFENMAGDGLHVVTDVINHFYKPKRNFPVRRQIEARFRTVYDRLVAQYQPTRVLVIAHSQGTVITFNALAEIGSADGRPLPTDVVTVGSPLTHLYQHYFPVEYPAHDPRFSTLRQFVKQWRNIFRTDDFVGTFVDFNSANPKASPFPKNIPAAPGGHTRYWEADIFQHVTDLIP